MTDKMEAQSTETRGGLNPSGKNRIIQVVGGQLVYAALLFVAAGRLDWIALWIYIGLWFAAFLTVGLWIVRRNPELVNERGRMAEETKDWDKALMRIYIILLLATIAVIGLDAGRFGWSSIPLAWQIVGFALLVPACALPWWTMVANPFLATTVRIQEERGHQVVTTGPYEYVRHPMYVGVILMWLCTPVCLGSWWGLIPGGLIAIMLVVRTALEDRTLQQELAGYAEYAQRVRYRLLPGIW